MGGKTNPAQRTKNSVRPSSSGRSAEFLQGNSYTFSGFLAGAGENSTLKAPFETPINEDIALIDPNIQVVLKKLTKKDSVTKGKALLELTQLIEDSDIEIVKAVLPLWPRLFKSLYADINHRVREYCQQAHRAFVCKLSKQLAPILKQLCAEWIGSQFDTYAPAASVAKASLCAAFPPHKLKDVLAFCHDEILDYVHRMLLVPMPMPSDKSYTPEEYEARSERLVYMGLFTFKFYLENTADNLWKSRLEKHQALLVDGKFWSYAKHKSPQIKAAWLECIGAILDKTTGLLDDYHPKIVSAVVHNLDESDAVVQSAAWTCLLRVQLQVDNWIQHTSVEKALLVKFRKVLCEPNQGLATHLLPFISHMNDTILTTHTSRFYMEFFESLKTALTKTKSGNSHELKVLVDTYFECLHFVIRQLQVNADFIQVEDRTSWKSEFVQLYFVNVIKWAIVDNSKALDHVARNTSMVLNNWDTNKEQYAELWSVFWLKMEENFLTVETVSATTAAIQLIVKLRKIEVTNVSSPQKKKRVTFGEKDASDDDTESTSAPSSPIKSTRIFNWPELFKLADLICQQCIQQMNRCQNPLFIKLLYKLLTQFDDARLVHSIDKVLPLPEFVDRVLQWISDESMASEEMVDLLMTYGVRAMPLDKLVDELMKIDSYAVRNWTVTKVSASEKVSLVDCNSIAVYMEHILMRLVNKMTTAENAKILKTYFDKTLDGGLVEVHSTMIEMICTEIEERNGAENKQLCGLSKYLLKRIVGSDVTNVIIRRLFLTVFKLNLEGVDEEANIVLEHVVQFEKVKVDRELVELCTEQITARIEGLFGQGVFETETALKCCQLLLLKGDVQHLDVVLKGLETEKEDSYIMYLAELVTCVNGEVVTMDQLTNQKVDVADHLNGVMRAVKGACLRAALLSQEAEEEWEKLEAFYGSAKRLAETGLEDPRFVTAVSELSEVIHKFRKTPTISTTPAKILPPKEDAPIADQIAFQLSSLCAQLQEQFTRSATSNTLTDRTIIRESLQLISKIMPLSKSRQLNLMYNTKSESLNNNCLWLATDLAVMLKILLENSPSEFTPEQWDFLRIAMSSWILTVSNALTAEITDNLMIRFMTAVLELFATLMVFFESERKKSSTQLFCKVIEEWNSVFAREVNTVLLLVLHKLMNPVGDVPMKESAKYLLVKILPCFERINFIYLIVSKDISKTVSQQQFLLSLLTQLSHPVAAVRFAVLKLAYCAIVQLVTRDNDQLLKSDSADGLSDESNYLATIIQPLMQLEAFDITEYVEDFQYRATATNDRDSEAEEGQDKNIIEDLPLNKSTAYFYLWHVILKFCKEASPELRSFYAKWIASRGWEAQLLKMIFKSLPQDVLRNFETKSSMVDTYFNTVKAMEICDKSLNTEQLVCYTYLNLVRLLPAVVRKCWTNMPHRTTLLLERFNMFYASGLLCHEELRALVDQREKMDNIQISVHHSTREIVACYAKEEARMELMITLPLNYPLAVAKVEGGKSVNSRVQSKEVLMQLNLFLSHQNGTIFNGLSLWKRNLDKKFEGVEECYVCYSVIHQDTYQLPKLTCKTCKKRFHSPCLYRWFSTSNKSTCPICRNIF